ncbi:hypothetical protein BH10ACI2_BH10ACI2_19690 [soil metagenome]
MVVACSAILVVQVSVAAQAEVDPQEAVTAFNSAQDLHEKGDLAGAIKLYEKALKIVPEFPEAAYQLGIAQIAVGKPDDAERSFRRAVELRPDWSLALAKFGETLVSRFLENRGPDRSSISAEAAAVLKKALATDPNNSPAVVAMAELLLNNSTSYAGILEVLEKLRGMTDGKLKPAASLWVARASLESRLGKTDLAKSSLANALAADQKNRAALFQLADIAIVEGNTGRATELAAQLDGGPGADQLNLLKARIFAADGRLDEAVKRLDAIRGSSAAADDLRTKIRSMQSSSPAELEKQLESNAKNPVVLGRLCTMYRRDDPAKSLDYCRRAAEAEPGNIHHAVGFGAALVQAKQYDAAVSILRKVTTIAPDNSSAHANLATALFQLKRFPEAMVEFEWLTSNQPSSAGAYLFLGILHDQMAEYMDAMANYQQYIRLADPIENKLDIDKVNLRLPALQKLIKEGKGKKG